MSDLKELTVVVTGAARGMGRAIAEMLVGEGATLAIADLDSESVKAFAEELSQKGGRILAQTVDITQEEQVATFFEQIEKELGGADVLLNIPGLSIASPIAEMDLNDYRKIFDVNMMGTFLCSKHFLAHVDPDRGGQIINFASMASKRANPNAPVYCAAKAAVSMFSDGMALQTTSKNVRVTTLNPGPTDTNFWAGRQVPLEKFMQPSDIAEAVHFILSLPSRLVVHELSFESFEFLRSK